jgi:hypothetical protein
MKTKVLIATIILPFYYTLHINAMEENKNKEEDKLVPICNNVVPLGALYTLYDKFDLQEYLNSHKYIKSNINYEAINHTNDLHNKYITKILPCFFSREQQNTKNNITLYIGESLLYSTLVHKPIQTDNQVNIEDIEAKIKKAGKNETGINILLFKKKIMRHLENSFIILKKLGLLDSIEYINIDNILNKLLPVNSIMHKETNDISNENYAHNNIMDLRIWFIDYLLSALNELTKKYPKLKVSSNEINRILNLSFPTTSYSIFMENTKHREFTPLNDTNTINIDLNMLLFQLTIYTPKILTKLLSSSSNNNSLYTDTEYAFYPLLFDKGNQMDEKFKYDIPTISTLLLTIPEYFFYFTSLTREIEGEYPDEGTYQICQHNNLETELNNNLLMDAINHVRDYQYNFIPTIPFYKFFHQQSNTQAIE